MPLDKQVSELPVQSTSLQVLDGKEQRVESKDVERHLLAVEEKLVDRVLDICNDDNSSGANETISDGDCKGKKCSFLAWLHRLLDGHDQINVEEELDHRCEVVAEVHEEGVGAGNGVHRTELVLVAFISEDKQGD